ncbi:MULTISPECIES: MarR family winged helix-turn-helix transcriptional regulator [Actinosynnema]|uniref:MarR family transcriptional regulator n=1 Tax=Actinosynnema pretiosum TaxID=42197 RepID=A0A290ZFY4_9PSEU|nr:MarR family transcriptional regulator [Actinosynnema pretiosum]ATE57917.1 MarR family transcriptional regulator [Actinosynnema pretiosum]
MTTPEDAHGGGRSDEGLADRFGTALVRLNKMHAALSANLSKAGIDKASFILLANLAQMGPSRASALAEAVFSDPSTVSRQVAGLVKDGLVERRADPDDGRASVLAVTDNGLSLLHERRRVRNAALARLFSDWSTHDWTTFVEHFERFVEGYEKALPDFIAEGGQGPRSEGEK